MANIQLQSNQLNGTLPDQWSSLNLQLLELGTNDLTGSLPAIWGTSPIADMFQDYRFTVGENKLTGTIPASWAGSYSRWVSVGEK